MSGKGSSSNNNDNNNNNRLSGTSGGTDSTAPPPQPSIVSGWQYHQYAQSSPNRYVYIGKDEDGEPEFLDYGPKSTRN